MAPSKKSKSLSKRFPDYAEVSLDKGIGNMHKRQQRRRKLDMLGSQWSTEELERFYEAYRKYGKDWKKVAGFVRNRSAEMVEALYNMNRLLARQLKFRARSCFCIGIFETNLKKQVLQAYLSLPEGTASVVGLIAMMTDHYNVLEGSDSGRESNDASRLPGKSQKHDREKLRFGASKDLLQARPVASVEGCLSLLERRCFEGCAVRKRTPRFPVSYALRKDDHETYVSPNRRGQNNIAHGAALALRETSHRGGSPQTSQSPYGTKRFKSSPFKSQGKVAIASSKSEMALPELHHNLMDGDCMEGSVGSREAENDVYAREGSVLMDSEGVDTVEVLPKGRKVYVKKEKGDNIRVNHHDDGGEACSGSSEGLDARKAIDITIAKIEHLYSQEKRKRNQKLFFGGAALKRNKKLFFGDKSSDLDALQTLADLSLMASTVESESSVRLKEEKPPFDLDDRSSLLETTSIRHRREKTKISGASNKVLNASGRSKHTRDSRNEVSAPPEAEEQCLSMDKLSKRKRKAQCLKASGEGERSESKRKHTDPSFVPSSQLKSIRLSDCSSSSSYHKKTGAESAMSTAKVITTMEVNLSIKRRSKRKMDPKRMTMEKGMKFLGTSVKSQPNKQSSHQDRDQISCCLLSHMVRRWCTFEWFYSAIDYPWFAKSDFVEYLNHVGLGHTPRLTRVEWGVIRSSLGKPRRFSERFLGEEREKLREYRECVRNYYSELRGGIREGLATDLARPLSVGQRVIALHPKSRDVHDGSVLTVHHDKCRIQFDRPELGVEFVLDIDCMPSNPLDNMPEALKKQNISVGNFSADYGEPRAGLSIIGVPTVFSTSKHVESAWSPINTLVKPAKGDFISVISPANKAEFGDTQETSYNQSSTVAHIFHAREADRWALSNLTRALDKKEVILTELKHVNDDLFKNHNAHIPLEDFELLKKQYAMVLLQLKEASDQVSSALVNLRQRNTCPGNSQPLWMQPPITSIGVGGPANLLCNSSINYQELEFNVVEILKDSKLKARMMVDAAIQAIFLMKEGEDVFGTLGEALDALHKQKSPLDSLTPSTGPLDQMNGDMVHQPQLTYALDPLAPSNSCGPNLHHDSDISEAQIPLELITSCVATLLMIQTCTERQHPPAVVAQILDSAATSLQPCCPQNLSIYREIQMCMGRIKTQILALVPS